MNIVPEQMVQLEYHPDEVAEDALSYFLKQISFRGRMGRKEAGILDRAMSVYRAGKDGLSLNMVAVLYHDCKVEKGKFAVGETVFPLPRMRTFGEQGECFRAYAFLVNAGRCSAAEGMDELLAHMWGSSFALAGQDLLKREIDRLEMQEARKLLSPIWVDGALRGRALRSAHSLLGLLDVAKTGAILDSKTGLVKNRGLGGLIVYAQSQTRR